MALLVCKNLTLGYDGNRVISDLSFAVDSGDYLFIVGDNGSGKSTLMKTILKLKTPLSGQIIIGDGLGANEIGYLPQQTIVQKDFPASVREVVRSGCLSRRGIRPYYDTEEKQTAEDNMKKLGISDLAKSCYRELSGGQQQRVLLARALCATDNTSAKQKILLLDEPVAGLDPKASNDMYELIAKLNKNGTTILMISHDIPSAVKYASHILHIDDKSALFFGRVGDYLKSEAGNMYNANKATEVISDVGND